jgi:hypothetical protein
VSRGRPIYFVKKGRGGTHEFRAKFLYPPTLEKEKLGPKKRENKIIQKDDGKYQRQVNDQRASERAIRHDKYEPPNSCKKIKKKKRNFINSCLLSLFWRRLGMRQC